MCEPVSIMMGVAAIGGAIQQQQNQRKQMNYSRDMVRSTEQNAAAAAGSDYEALAGRVIQTRASVAQEAFEASRAADRARGSLVAGAEGAGLAGGSIDDLRMSITAQLANQASARNKNLTWTEQQIARQFDSVRNQHQSRLNSAMPNPVPGVDYMGLLGGLVGAYAGYSDRQENRAFREQSLALRIPGQRP